MMNSYQQHSTTRLRILLIAFLLTVAGAVNGTPAIAKDNRYQNPLSVHTPEGMTVESCADPSIGQSHQPDEQAWYMYCTTDPLSGSDRDGTGQLIFHLVPIFK